ncbi:beta-hexosaminidase [Rhodobacter veldkampii DSM 11550]|uniref:beta-N-acetylhexosaminidase n=2 Tax=Phaeovulum veldkampii TaxID=33049 RepID=A0A2T4JKT9_9RHOB|nr:glycoside hydrolase family 3 N-terminal domain-containing protein [Phaeovulum veldkampii]MBK5947563.1 beta-hexosaminidase [Phaeovulum veldkampii DSM 11550]PTE18492.1 beta-hexosaminidase [Phaeovulum veldkampii DSM 11550]TDQ59233.1 beta-N-acetylhexosaminidase [Phaeovulum veldkampii DSM 11550]
MAAGATILGCAGAVLTPDETAFFRAADPWGFILFARNVETPDQLRRLTGDLRAGVGRAAPILIDQEGGRVARLRPPHWRDWLPPLDQVARAGAAAPRSLWLRARLMAAELRAVGIDANCAPCADIAGPRTHPFLRNRCLGETAAEVARNARALAEGLLAGGVLPVVKHIPGHGRAEADSHLHLPTVTATPEDLSATDFAAFAALADLPLGMTAHIRFPAFDDAPATASARMIGLIRDVIGFQGLLMTDDISMQALAGPVGTRAAAAIAAGCDLVLHCNGEMPEMAAVVAAAGRLSPAAEARATAALACRHAPEPADECALTAELTALLAGGGDGRA